MIPCTSWSSLSFLLRVALGHWQLYLPSLCTRKNPPSASIPPRNHTHPQKATLNTQTMPGIYLHNTRRIAAHSRPTFHDRRQRTAWRSTDKHVEQKNQTYSAAVQVVTQDAVFLSFVSYDIMTGRLKNCNCNERFKTGLRVLQESYDACRCRARGPTAVEALLLYRQACHGDKARTTCLHYISCRTANQDRRT